MRLIYQWGQTYRNRHGGAYPSGSTDFLMDVANHPQNYRMRHSGDGPACFKNSRIPTCVSPSAHHTTHASPYVMFAPRLDGRPLGSSKPAGTRDVLASTDMYEHTNWSHGIPVGHTGFWLVLWDDGTVARVPGERILYVPRGGLTDKSVTPAIVHEAVRRGGADVTFGFPGQAGLPGDTLTGDQTRAAGLGAPSF